MPRPKKNKGLSIADLSTEQLKAITPKATDWPEPGTQTKKIGKFGTVINKKDKPTVDGIKFDSKAEAKHYGILKLRQLSGEISNLELQEKFIITINGIKVCTYRADFSYVEKGRKVVVDVKGFKTPEYRLKKKMMAAALGIDILEV